jgi:hypothetical protein
MRKTTYYTSYRLADDAAAEVKRGLERAVGANSSNKIRFTVKVTDHNINYFECNKHLSINKHMLGQAFIDGWHLGMR